jgi:hypothetical protein
MSLSVAWIAAKESERVAVEARREIENQILEELGINLSIEGNQKYGDLTITTRHTQTVDVVKVQELAREHSITEHLGSLFRWKAEIDARAWKATSSEITSPLLTAITRKPGRPSFALRKGK